MKRFNISFKKGAGILVLCLFGIFFASCSTQVYRLEPGAESVSFLPSIPQNCTYLGEIKAQDGDPNLRGSVVGPIKDMNIENNVDVQLRNQAAKLGKDTKIVIYNIKTVCNRLRNSSIISGRVFLDYETTLDCATLKTQYPKEAFMVYLEAAAYLYRCP